MERIDKHYISNQVYNQHQVSEEIWQHLSQSGLALIHDVIGIESIALRNLYINMPAGQYWTDDLSRKIFKIWIV